ncbi:LAMI_0B02982g1_1 [Lachancea mirantina]|uniref:Dolichyldiphosphatase n=1 Tax=Lachancea mirantina TaxID=1230905 RepID=A0A1G4IU88_9SACH|nr:LAMI_0B02982g1_1 [Lachancea mirantina]
MGVVRIPFDETFILYDPSDALAYVLVYFSLLPIGILIFYFSWFISGRELEAVIIAGGQVVNEIFNNILKNWIGHARPMSFGASFQKDTMRSEYGMPSAHSQFMGFFCMYWSLKIVTSWTGLSRVRKTVSLLAFFLSSICVAFSRWYLGYHSFDQVSIGVTLGGFLGSLYFMGVGILRYLGLIDWVLSWKISRALRIKDSFNNCPLSLAQELEQWHTRCLAASEKKNA